MAFAPIKKKKSTFRLLDAAFNGNLRLLKKVAAENADGKGLARTAKEVKDSKGRGALHLAATEGMTDVSKYLLEEFTDVSKHLLKELKFNVDVRYEKGETLFLHVVLGGYLSMSKYLLDPDANPAATSESGFTPLHYAAEKRGNMGSSLEASALMWRYMPPPRVVAFSWYWVGSLKLEFKPSTGTQKLLRLLISKGVDVDPQHDSGTPLQWAATHRKQDAVKILLEHHANPNVVFHHMFTPPVASVFSESSECTLLLIQAITADPSDVSVLSNWSLCWVRLGQGERALGDAKECRFLRPDWPKACYREGAAWR